MLTIYLTGTNAEYMRGFKEFLEEALAGDLDGLYRVFNPREYEDGEVLMKVALGEDRGDDENIIDLDYDRMFQPKEHMTPTRRKWML